MHAAGNAVAAESPQHHARLHDSRWLLLIARSGKAWYLVPGLILTMRCISRHLVVLEHRQFAVASHPARKLFVVGLHGISELIGPAAGLVERPVSPMAA